MPNYTIDLTVNDHNVAYVVMRRDGIGAVNVIGKGKSENVYAAIDRAGAVVSLHVAEARANTKKREVSK